MQTLPQSYQMRPMKTLSGIQTRSRNQQGGGWLDNVPLDVVPLTLTTKHNINGTEVFNNFTTTSTAAPHGSRTTEVETTTVILSCKDRSKCPRVFEESFLSRRLYPTAGIRHAPLYIFARTDIKTDGHPERAGEYEERGFTLVKPTTAAVITMSNRDKSNSVLAMDSRRGDYELLGHWMLI
ncbi:unnamed protein product, partial [Iphiclides podalirius]